MELPKSIGEFFEKHQDRKEELLILRDILLSAGLEETLKWGAPTYTYDGKNIAGIGAFKTYFGLWFFQGVLLTDPYRVLINAQKDKTRAQRQWRFQSKEEINPNQVLSYTLEAIENQKAGREIKPNLEKPVEIPPQLKDAFQNVSNLEKRYRALSLSKRRDYAEYIADAKREETKLKRLDKIIPMIMEGKGLNDKYK